MPKKSRSCVSGENSSSVINGAFMDEFDVVLVGLLSSGYQDKEIANKTEIPLRRIQSRTRRLVDKGLIKKIYKMNYKKLGFKKAFIYICLSDCDIQSLIEKLAGMSGVVSIGVHLGNSNIITGVVYRDNNELLHIITDIKRCHGVERIVWSEVVYTVASNLKKLILV